MKTLEEKQAEMRERNAQKPKRFEPGVSGNPAGKNAGRPKALLPLTGVADIVRERCSLVDRKTGKADLYCIIDNMVEIAKGKKNMLAVRSAQELLDRGWGKPLQTIQQNVHFTRDEDLRDILDFLGIKDDGADSRNDSIN